MCCSLRWMYVLCSSLLWSSVSFSLSLVLSCISLMIYRFLQIWRRIDLILFVFLLVLLTNSPVTQSRSTPSVSRSHFASSHLLLSVQFWRSWVACKPHQQAQLLVLALAERRQHLD